VRLDWPLALAALLLVPLACALALTTGRRRTPYAVRYTNIEVLESVASTTSRWRARLPALCSLLALTCALAALARPEARIAVAREPASIVLAVDMSGSMAAADVRPTRLAAAQAAIHRFVAGLPAQDRVGLVTFSDTASVAAPLTRDHGLVVDALAFSPAPGQGTAIGDAIARSVELLDPAPHASSRRLESVTAATEPTRTPMAILLLSDGAQTRGRLTPLQGAARAAERGIPIYAIALGTARGEISAGVIRLRVPPDPVTLRSVARSTGGTFAAPADEMRLDDAYARIASRLGSTRAWRELTFVLVGLAALFGLVGGALSVIWQERLP
jgi:Ca-activated chloride channel family protein